MFAVALFVAGPLRRLVYHGPYGGLEHNRLWLRLLKF